MKKIGLIPTIPRQEKIRRIYRHKKKRVLQLAFSGAVGTTLTLVPSYFKAILKFVRAVSVQLLYK